MGAAIGVEFWRWLRNSWVPFRRLNDSRAVRERPASLHLGARLAPGGSGYLSRRRRREKLRLREV